LDAVEKRAIVIPTVGGSVAFLMLLLYLDALRPLFLWLEQLPFYTLNAWGFWLTLMNTVLIVAGMVYVRRKGDVVKVVLLIQQTEEKTDVSQVMPKLRMETFEHV